MYLYCLAKVKFDLRDPDEFFLAKREIESLLETKTEIVSTIASLFRKKPFGILDDEVIHLMSRLVYLGEGHGFLAKVPIMNLINIAKRATFFREIYIFFVSENFEEILGNIGICIDKKSFTESKIEYNSYAQIFLKEIEKSKEKLVTVRLLPFQTLFEYATEIKKLPPCVFKPKNSENWKDYFEEKELGVEKGLNELINHLKKGHFCSPHFGLGKTHIGDFVDWASTDLKKPFLHYLHKYKGKGDPRMSRALITLLRVKEGDTILDPFAGSGAFIADAPTMGINALGIEILNIGKMIAEVKCNLAIDINKLKSAIVDLFSSIDNELFKKEIKDKLVQLKEKMKKEISSNIPFKKIEPYLEKIIQIKEKIEDFEDEKIRNFLLILLSQQIVEYSEKSRGSDIIDSFKSYVEDRYLVLYAT